MWRPGMAVSLMIVVWLPQIGEMLPDPEAHRYDFCTARPTGLSRFPLRKASQKKWAPI